MLDVANYFLYSTNLDVCENFTQRQAFSWIMNMLIRVERRKASRDSNQLTLPRLLLYGVEK